MWTTARGRRRATAISIAVSCILLLLVLRHSPDVTRGELTKPSVQLGPLHPEPHAPSTTEQAVRVHEPFLEQEPLGSKSAAHDKEDASREIELVVASTKSEDTSWLHTFLPDWHKNVYVVDDPNATLTVPMNKGHEAMVYLTYIIDHYDRLPANVLFLHASRFAWHNDDPDYDGLPTLKKFQVPYLRESGYVNLRCVWAIGCPAEIRPVEDHAQAGSEEEGLSAKHVYKQAFEELLPDTPMPAVVAVSCCSQFGATREAIRKRPKKDYVHFREWLSATPLDDSLNGRVLEFSWHIIFGKEPVYCPSASDCYCKVFGMCDMQCTDDSCVGRYTLPPYATLPQGWPRKGWEEEDRTFLGPL